MLPTLALLALLSLLLPSSRRVHAVRRIAGKAGLVAFICATLLLAVVAFVAILGGAWSPQFGGDTEGVDLTYEQYISAVGNAGLVPKGASEICFRCHSTIDSYDFWLKVRLPSAAYDSLLAKMSADLQDPDFVSTKKNILLPVKKTVSESPDLPGNWPSPEVNPPSWFESGRIGDQVQCTQWDVQLADRAKGWYWLYDLDSETLRISEWNRQHFKVP